MFIIMPRRRKCRMVGTLPETLFFKPRGIPASDLEVVELSMDELEAIKLKDLRELEQEECARRMGISRPTFHRILRSARKKIADALLNGKAIRLDAHVKLINARKFRCRNCMYEFTIPHGRRIVDATCPSCGSNEFESLHKIVWR